MAKTRLTTSPNSRAKAYQPTWVFVWETYVFDFFFGSHNLWVSHVEAFAVLYGRIWHKSALGTEYAMLLLLFDTPFPGLNKHYNWFGRDSTPNWILDGFKFLSVNRENTVVNHR